MRPLGTSHGSVGSAASSARMVIGIGELAVSQAPSEIVTHALGSCIAVCLWDSSRKVAGMLHFLLPDSRINATRAQEQPEAFADTGIPLLVKRFAEAGGNPKHAVVKIVGGADIGAAGTMNIGRRNILAAKTLLWKQGLLLKGDQVGGTVPRTVYLDAGTGQITVTTGGQATHL